MNELLIKTFYKRKAVIIKMVDENNRITTHWAIPDKYATVKLINDDRAVVLTKESMLLSTKHNIPTFLVNYKNCEPIDVKNINKNIYGAGEFKTIINNDMADKVFKTSNKQKISEEGKIIIIVIIVCVMSLGYFMNTKLVDLKKSLTPESPIVEVIPDEVDDDDEDVNPYAN